MMVRSLIGNGNVRSSNRLEANGKSNRTIARRIDVSESTVERITKQMNEMEYKRRKSGSDRPLKITHKLRKSFKKLALLNKRDGSRKLAPKVLKVNSIQVYQREQRGQTSHYNNSMDLGFFPYMLLFCCVKIRYSG